MKKIFLLFIILTSISHAQLPTLTSVFHQQRREAFRKQMPENSVAIFVSSPHQKRSMSSTYKYKQNNDLYYFTGIMQPETILVIFKNESNFAANKTNEFLFLAQVDQNKELWDGQMLTHAKAKKISGIDVIHGHLLMWAFVNFIDSYDYKIIVHADLHCGKENETMKSVLSNIDLLKKPISSLETTLNSLRGVKTAEEIEMMKQAIIISGKGHIEAMKAIKPGVSERQVQAVHEFSHRILGSDDVGYLPIVGAGNNGCILHYHENSKTNLTDGLILMDVGAEYLGYTADITRTVPVKGKFNAEEKLIYELVLKALEAGITVSKKGSNFREINQVCRRVIDDGLVELGVVEKNAKHNFFPHGIGHHLGLDVHDRGTGNFQPGMVITVEPGIYIPENSAVDKKWWGIAVRIEDNILITETGHENLTDFVPKTVKAIEKIMGTSDFLEMVD